MMNYPKSRLFLSQLQYNLEYHSPILSEQEVVNESLKRLKMLVLARLGFSSLRYLDSTIQRFDLHELANARISCMQLTTSAIQTGNEFLLIVKVVPHNVIGQLVNFRIQSVTDVKDTFLALSQKPLDTTTQIWLCKVIIDEEQLNISGRLYLSNTCDPEQIELVWTSSPRLLDKFQMGVFEYPYLKASRNVGKLGYTIYLLHIASKHKIQKLDKYLKEGRETIRRVWLRNNKFVELSETVYAAGAKPLCIEFMINNNRLSFIDWDTEVELYAR